MPDPPSVSPASQATSSQLPFPALLPLQNLKDSDSVLVHALFSFYILSLGFKFSGGGGIGKGVRAVWGCHNDGVEAPLPAFSGWGPKRPNRGQYHQRTVQPKSNTHPPEKHGNTSSPMDSVTVCMPMTPQPGLSPALWYFS